ncbi:MAG TPA: thioredoxin domain-containing protein [Lacunisphaera sp.]|nr:thioredoxin domain-containing protein [Lacunisphaera sp.]
MKRILSLFPVLCLLSTISLAAATKGPEPLHISQGEKVNLADYLVPGKIVVFDFTSKYCGPCQRYNGPLQTLHAKRDDVVVVKVDINRPDVKGIDWRSPVAAQFELHSIPHFKVYSPAGKLIAEDKVVIANNQIDRAASSQAGRQMVDGMISKLDN